MSVVLDEGVLCCAGEMLLGGGSLPVRCNITVEWLRDILEPTWYGYFTASRDELCVLPLPGAYHLRLPDGEVRILVRRPARHLDRTAFAFWGIGPPPAPLTRGRG